MSEQHLKASCLCGSIKFEISRRTSKGQGLKTLRHYSRSTR